MKAGPSEIDRAAARVPSPQPTASDLAEWTIEQLSKTPFTGTRAEILSNAVIPVGWRLGVPIASWSASVQAWNRKHNVPPLPAEEVEDLIVDVYRSMENRGVLFGQGLAMAQAAKAFGDYLIAKYGKRRAVEATTKTDAPLLSLQPFELRKLEPLWARDAVAIAHGTDKSPQQIADDVFFSAFSIRRIPPLAEQGEGWQPYIDSWIRLYDFVKEIIAEGTRSSGAVEPDDLFSLRSLLDPQARQRRFEIWKASLLTSSRRDGHGTDPEDS